MDVSPLLPAFLSILLVYTLTKRTTPRGRKQQTKWFPEIEKSGKLSTI